MELIINEKKEHSNIKILYGDEDEIIYDKLIDKDGFEYTINDEIEKGIYTIDAQMRKEKYLDNKYPLKKKPKHIELTKKVIMISLYDLGFNVFTNTANLSSRHRDELQERMRYYEIIDVDIICKKFNKVCNYEIFDNPKLDYSKLPVYN